MKFLFGNTANCRKFRLHTHICQVIDDTENYVTDIKYDDDFRNVKVYAEKDKVPEEFSDFDATLLKIMGSSMAYQIYTTKGQSVNITVLNAQNEEVLKSVSYPVVIE